MAQDAAAQEEGKPIVGTDESSIDQRGRILLGKKKQRRLGDLFAIAISEIGCITCFPNASWQARIDEINSYPPNNQGRQKYSRLLLGESDDELSCDPQGRVVLPGKLKELGKLKEKVLLVGCGDRLEIWDPEEYEKWKVNPDEYCKDRREAMQQAYNEMKS